MVSRCVELRGGVNFRFKSAGNKKLTTLGRIPTVIRTVAGAEAEEEAEKSSKIATGVEYERGGPEIRAFLRPVVAKGELLDVWY